MQDQLICPHCNKPIPLTEALSHQLQEKFQKEFDEERKNLYVKYQNKLEEERVKLAKETEEKVRAKIEKEMQLRLTDSQNEREELHKQNKQLQEQFLELNKVVRQLRTENETKALELEKKFAAEQERIRLEEQKRIDAQYHLKMLENEKKLSDAMRANDDLRRKLEQGSQQMQGEVLELELETILKRDFPYDDILPVPKGVRGADVMQVVKNTHGRICGTILWELKRTKAWSNEWVSKLKEDQRAVKAEMAVIITQVIPDTLKEMGNIDGVWVGKYEMISGLAQILRTNLLEVSLIKFAAVGKNEKMDVLYNYLSGIEFKQRIEAIIEAFSNMQEDLEREKRWFTQKWAKQEKNIRKVIDNTTGMHGDLQSIMGKELADIASIALLPPEEEPAADGILFK
ncbi:DUF2130 domain-containing protein [Candidatus Roizmanbacteria bacterium]|nr:DUF2130 domain-containing protein [Candidatus Roizmanbacteria bacterium]